jgi:hypothetical protein
MVEMRRNPQFYSTLGGDKAEHIVGQWHREKDKKLAKNRHAA